MKLSKRGAYALRVLRRLGENYGKPPLSVTLLAETESVPPKYLEQILSTLRKAGILVSTHGKEGGYGLRVPPEQITVGAILRAIDGPLAPIPCASRTAPHACTDCPYPFDSCWLRRLMLRVRDNISAILDQETVADLMAESKNKRKVR